jgi:hypothetical protein
MSTLEEIEAAIAQLPPSEQQQLLESLVGRSTRTASKVQSGDDPVEKIIGAFAGPHDSTGRDAEGILYGRGS